MGKRNELEQEPLLYIAQPQVQKTRVSMQQSFIIKTDKREKIQKKAENKDSFLLKQETQEAIEDEKVDGIQSAAVENIEEAVNEEEEMNLDTAKDVEAEETARKSFKDLDNKQKIYYLLNRPHYIPDVLCECRTHSGMYIGYVKSFENQIVTLRAYNQLSTIKIPYSDIINIQMRMV